MLLRKYSTLDQFALWLLPVGCAAVLLVGCAHKGAKFDADWEFCESEKGEAMACLSVEDVQELKRVLNSCEVK